MPVDTHNLSHEERLKTACWRLDVTSMGATDLDCGLAGFNDADIIKLTKILARNPILLELNLSGNTCGEDGTRGLARALRVNKTLTKLDLHNNLIGDYVLSLVEALRINRSLTTLNLIDNQISDNGALEIAGALAGRDGDGGWASVSSLRLGVNKWGKMGNAALLRSLTKNTALTHLDLSRCKLNGVKDGPLIASALQVNRTLHTLVLDYNELGDVGVTSIAKSLNETATERAGLALRWPRPLPGEHLKPVRGLGNRSSIRSSLISSSSNSSSSSSSSSDSASRRSSFSMSAASQRSLPPPPPGVRVLSLANNGIGDDGAAALVGACVRGGMAHLNLAMNKIADKCGAITAALATAAAPKSTAAESTMPLPHVYCALEELDLSHNAIGAPEAVDALAAAVRKITTYPLNLVLHGNRGVGRPMAFPSGAVKKFKPRLLNPRPTDSVEAVAAVDGEKEEEEVIEEEEAPPLTYINRLARTVDNALLMKERRAAELRAQPYDADRMQAYRLSDREWNRAARNLAKARDDRRQGKEGPWSNDPNSEDEVDSDFDM